jgi:MOSC domain-containing protein YiiM
MSTRGRIVHLYLRPSARTPVREVREALAVAGVGLEGDHNVGGKREVTVLSREGWEAACAAVGAPALSPGGRRANVVVEGVDLAGSIGKRLRLGPVEVAVRGETRPCQLMDDVHPGLMEALRPDRRAGVNGALLAGGTLRVGDEVEVLDAPAPNAARSG